MTKILHTITGLNDGGAEAVLYRLVTFDDRHRHIVVSLSDGGKYAPLLSAKGIEVHCLDMPRGRLTLSGLRRLWAVLRRERPQIVQTWMYHANLVGGVIAKLAGVKNIYWGIRHTDLVPGTTGRSTRMVDRLCARISPYVPSGIIACAEKAKDVHITNGYDAGKFTVIPNGYDIAQFSPDAEARQAFRQQLGIVADARVLGLVGRWDPQKDHANLIRAFSLLRKRMPDLHLVLAGTDCDDSNAELMRLLQEAGGMENVHLLGRRSDIPSLMNALDLHVLSSYSEAFPNVVAEAMACGTPCVVTDVGDAAVIVGNTGWVVPPRDSEALASAISEALAEQEKDDIWHRRQRAARQRIVDEFSLEAMVARYHSVWGLS
ncbi:GT4 family glycosyltransferase PelF [Chelativorans sp. SCAU2101]|uniref:GT4 family glycosyltransferase PelF n=1 Tax=Chelativorans petroleitrophicus TaxID=2975484 RepID=A0A9X2XCB3_9HYPH|nr:GT4 family glycosyltransferase PelF [Chelativorans petroleitrophicus]MCT8992266.1 GT4 family glycosyltransferase PelF [Chelativorans petroleitrophicus]